MLVYDEELGVCIVLFYVPDQQLKQVARSLRTDLHPGEAGLYNQRNLGRQDCNAFQPALSIPYVLSTILGSAVALILTLFGQLLTQYPPYRCLLRRRNTISTWT